VREEYSLGHDLSYGERTTKNMATSAQDIVSAAYHLGGAPYRPWRSGNSIPMWLDDGSFSNSMELTNHLRQVRTRS
jgi:hypothetical protein